MLQQKEGTDTVIHQGMHQKIGCIDTLGDTVTYGVLTRGYSFSKKNMQQLECTDTQLKGLDTSQHISAVCPGGSDINHSCHNSHLLGLEPNL